MTSFESPRIRDVPEVTAIAESVASKIRAHLMAEALDRYQNPTAILYDDARESLVLGIAHAIMRKLQPVGDSSPFAGLDALLSNDDANALVHLFGDVSRFLSRAHREPFAVLKNAHEEISGKLNGLKFDGLADLSESQRFAQSVGYMVGCMSCVRAGNISAAEDKFREAAEQFVSACRNEG